MMRFHSSLPQTSSLSCTNFSVAILIASCAPSVKPSPGTPLITPAVTDLASPASIPERSSIFSTMPWRAGPVMLRNNCAGSTESRPALTVDASNAAPGSKLPPVSSYMFWNISGAF